MGCGASTIDTRPFGVQEGGGQYSRLKEDDTHSTGAQSAGANSVTPKNPRIIKAVDIEETWLNVMDSLEEPGRVTGKTAERLVTKRMGWKTVRIFVSSTFKDFHDEREVLVKQIFPDLRAWCESRRLHLVECDLRWGVPKDSTTETTLRVCLGEIDRCYQDNIMPFFINMTSERIGWVPNPDEIPSAVAEEYRWVHGLSVTEMEIMHAAYRHDNPNAIFMLRDPSFVSEIPEEKKAVFVEDDGTGKLQILKDKLKERFPEDRVIEYQTTYEGINPETGNMKFSGLAESFGKPVREFFERRIAHQYPEPEPNQDPYLAVQERHESFMKSRAGSVIGREKICKEIDEYICGIGQNTPLLLLGGAGSGKSSIMAKMADQSLTKSVAGQIPGGGRHGWHVFYHFVGAVPGSTDLEAMLRRLLKALDVCTDDSMPSNLEDGAQLMYSTLSNVNTKPVIIIVDALNQFDEDKAALLMSWVPRKLAPQIRCVFSMIPDTPQHKAFSEREPTPHMILVTPLDDQSRKLIVEDMLGRYNKRLDDEQMSNLLSKKSSENPLWLSIACEELRVFGSFRRISDKINQLADGLLELEQQVMDRFEKENGGQLLVAALCLLETSATGLLETELLKILGDEETLLPKDKGEKEGKDDSGKEKSQDDISPLPAYKWAEIYRALKPFLRPFGDSGEGRLDFYHRSLSKAVRRKYFAHENVAGQAKTKQWWHHKLADFFQKSKNRERQLEEYPYHLIKLNDISRMELFLTEWEIFDMLFDEEFSSKLLAFWRKAGDKEYTRMGTCYHEKITNLANNPDVDKDMLSHRCEQIARLLAQGGIHDRAAELGKKTLALEKELGERPERMAEIYFLLAFIGDEAMKTVEFMYASQIPSMKLIINDFESSIALRKNMEGPKNQLRLGLCLNRLAFYYAGIQMRGGDRELSAASASQKAIESCDEAIRVFAELNDETRAADATTTKGVCCGRATAEQIKCYKKAQEIILRIHGEIHPKMDRINLNMAIYYEESGDYTKSYEYFRKCYTLACELYGRDHVKTQRSINTLREPMYQRMAMQKGFKVPTAFGEEDPDITDERNGTPDSMLNGNTG